MHSHSEGMGTGPGRVVPRVAAAAPSAGAGSPPCPAVVAPNPSSARRLWLVLGITFAFMVVEVVGGWLAGSLALLADAAHMLTDVGAIGLVLLTAWIARRPADDSKTYGYLRWEILAALVNGAVLFGVAVFVVIEAVSRIRHPEPIRAGLFLAVAIAALLANAISLFLLHADREHSLNTRGAYLHVLGDLLGSLGAIAAALIIRFTGWTLADPVLSILLSLLILGGAWRLVRESTDILLEAAPRHVQLPEVQRRILSVPGVAAVHDLHVWTVTSGMVAMSGHAVVPELAEHPRVLAGIRDELARMGIGHVTVQVEVGAACGEDGRAGRREGGKAGDS
jgi:cobalt-zinc-cadmium efflux system protein